MKALSLLNLSSAVLLSGGVLSGVHAGSLGVSSAAGGSAASVGSSASEGSSASSETSSNSSSGKQKTAMGPYRITEVAEVAGQPGQVRLQLQALVSDAAEPAHVLVLPKAIAEQYRLAAGQTITARPQAYGTEFVHDGSRQAFFLVLTDGFRRELESRPVLL